MSAATLLATPRHPQVTIFKKKGLTKFKIRCSKYLYTLSMRDADKVRCATLGRCFAGLRLSHLPLSIVPATLSIPYAQAKKLEQSLPPGLQKVELPK